ncbi:MAG: alpha/beta hydrolase [Thermodesulfobacteriota bacterium]
MIEESVFFRSDRLNLHGVLSYAEDLFLAPAVLLCPPHPQLGGNMDNNVIRAIHNLLAANDFVSFRFDYRGVGRSEGDAEMEVDSLKAFWEDSHSPLDLPRQQDAMAAFDYLRRMPGINQRELSLVGYSFGAHAALQIAADAPWLAAMVLVAPTLHFHDFDRLDSLTIPKLIVWSDNDFSCPQDHYTKRFRDFAAPKEHLVFPGADHFFIGHEAALSHRVLQFLKGRLNA